MARYKYKFGNRLGVRAPLYQTKGEYTPQTESDIEYAPTNKASFRDKIRNKFNETFGTRQKWGHKGIHLFGDNRELYGDPEGPIGTSMGEGKAMVTTDRFGNTRKIKEKGPKGKLKTKYNKDGTIKKQVLKRGLRRIVHKPERDNRLSEFNRMRNIQDEQRATRNPEVQKWIMDNMPELFND